MNNFLVELATRSLILAGIGLAIRYALIRSSAHARANVLAITMGALVLLPLALILLPRLHITVAQSHSTTTAASANSASIINQPTFPWMLIYAGFAGVMLVKIAISLIQFRKLEQGLSHASPTLTERVMSLAARAREVFFCPAGEPPMTWGLLQPKIALPAESENWIEPQLRSVVLHEDAHIRRRDWAVMIGFRIVSAIYWFNPLVWILKMLFDQDSERAADDFVLAQGVDAPEYAGRLVEVAKTMRHRPSILPAVTMARSHRLNGRISAILDSRTKRGILRGWTNISVLAILLSGAGGAAIILPVVKSEVCSPSPVSAPDQAPEIQVVTGQPDQPDSNFDFDPIELVDHKQPTKEANQKLAKATEKMAVSSRKNEILSESDFKKMEIKNIDIKGLDDLNINIDMDSVHKEVAKGLAEASREMEKASKESEKDFKDAEAEIDKSEMPEAARQIAKASLAMAKDITKNLLKENKEHIEKQKKAKADQL